jgi:hypothetical protein
MSVTFTIESIPTGAFQFECHAGHEAIRIPLQATSYETAGVELGEHTAPPSRASTTSTTSSTSTCPRPMRWCCCMLLDCPLRT